VDQSLSKIIEQALEQALGLRELDAPRAEAWASDLMALASEAADPEDPADAVTALLVHLDTAGGLAGSIAAMSVRSLLSDPETGIETNRGTDPETSADIDGLPDWVGALGTSHCDGSWIFTNRRGESAVFRFADDRDATHVISIDLVPGLAESVGEVIVGPIEIIEVAEDPESEVEVTTSDPVELAGRVADAIASTVDVRQSLMINGRLLESRLAGLAGNVVVLPTPAVDEIPDLPHFDPDDDDYALDLLRRALGESCTDQATVPEATEPRGRALAAAAATLRRAAEVDDPQAQWLAASHGPVDLDEPDSHVILAALAAAIRPHSMAPLDPALREAVDALEWADWLGVVIGLVREGSGASTEPAHLVDLVNRCPEITSTIPKADRAQIEWALARCTDLWHVIGVTDDDRLTEFGVWVLPLVLASAWGTCR